MKGLLLLADGFEDTEALSTRDVLLRAGLDIVTCSIKDEKSVTSGFGVELLADTSRLSVEPSDYDFVILPGGGRGVRNLISSDFVKNVLLKMKEKYLFAICAAPSVLGKYGYLDGKNFTCFPGFEDGIKGHYHGDKGVVVDGKIITARSMYYSIEFGMAIIDLLLDQEVLKKVEVGTKGLAPKN